MWKEYYVFIVLFPCLIYVLCDTSSDDGPYRSPFDIELLQILRQISTKLHVISENTDRNWTLQFNAEMDNLKQENMKLRKDLETVLNETALEKKRSQKMDEMLLEKVKELQNLTISLNTGNIARHDKFLINQEKTNMNLTNTLVKLEEKTDKFAMFTNNSFKLVMQDVDLLNLSFSKDLAIFQNIITGKDCEVISKTFPGSQNGVYKIFPDGVKEVNVYCDMKNGGWTVFQRRQNGNTDFFRGWQEYKNGFGNPNDEHWLGNSFIHSLTVNRNCTLRIDLTNWDSISRYATYADFRIENEADNYRLRIGSYSGNAGYDSLSYHNNQEFSTKDRDNDKFSSLHCAVVYTGAWWYNACHHSNLNGDYSVRNNKGVRWLSYPSSDNMKTTTMKLKCTK